MESKSKGLLTLLFSALCLSAATSAAFAQSTYDYSVYVDSDANSGSGCTIGPVIGADVRLHVTASGGLAPQVNQVTRARCVGGTFSGDSVIAGNYPVGTNNGVAGSDVIELSDALNQLSQPGTPSVMFSIVATSATGEDVLVSADGSTGGPPFGLALAATPIPILGIPALVLMALLIAMVGARVARRRGLLRVAAMVFLFSGVVLAANFVVDGQVGDWGGVSPIANDPVGDATSGESAIDLRAFYAAIENDRVFMRIDVTNLQNNAPTAVAGSAITLEDQSVTVALTGTDNENDTLSFAIVNAPTNGSLGAITPTGPQSASVQYTPNADANGSDNFTFTTSDGQATSAAASMALTITPVNDVPGFTGGADQIVNEDVGAQSVSTWATAVSPGPANESSQVLDFIVSNDNNTLFSVQPAISPAGVLSYTPIADANGVATVTVSLHDDGGTANGGVDTSATQAFTITVNSVNDVPSFTKGADQAVAVNSGAQTVNPWATALSAGPANESGQALDFIVSNDNNTLFSAQPAVSPTGVLTYTPATGINGSTIVTVALHDDGGTANGGADTSAAQTFVITVSKTDQTISYTSTAPTTAQVGGATYDVTATATSGLVVAFTINASASSVCTVSGSTVAFIGTGTCVIDANQPGDAEFNPAPQVQQSFAVAMGDQTISYNSTAPAAAMVGGASYSVSATATSALAVVFTIDASASAVCTISGTAVSFIGAGTCVINANQIGDANWNAAPQAQQSFAVAKGDQAISYTSTAPAAATVGGASYTVAAAASSGLTVALTIDVSAMAVCSISGSTVFFIGAGTCVIGANQAGDANWNAATQAQQSFTVGKGDQTISYTSTAPVGATVGGATYTVTATASSGLTVAFTIDASASTVCTISGATVSIIGAGTCVIDANQAGDANWNAAPQVQQSFAVAKGDQTISYTSTAPAAAAVGGAGYTVTGTATSGLPVSFTIDASASAVCSISGASVSFIGAGTCVINANQTGDASWNAAPQVQQTFAVAKGNQTISYTSTAPVAAAVSGAGYTVTGTATSGLPVSFTIDASASAVCSISGASVSFIGAGTCVINANQAGDANWNAAPQVQQSFTVAKGNQTISYTSTAPAAATVGGATYTVTATASSGLTVALTIDASASAVCSISGSTVSFLSAGTCVIDANQAGDANWNAAPQAQQSFAVVKADQTISFTSVAPLNAAVGGATYAVSATATSGLTVAFTIAPASISVCAVSGSTVSFIGTGICTINADQPGDASYNAAPQVQQTFSVNQAPSITSANATSFTSTVAGTFTVTTIGFPTGVSMTISESGALPSGVTFVNNNDGTATLAGTPAVGTQGAWPFTITASNGVAPNATQSFILTVLNSLPTVIASPLETFDTVGNVQLEVKAAQTLSPGIFVVGNLVSNFTDTDGPSPLSAVAVVGGATTNGGIVDIATNGGFTFTPMAGDTAATDTFSYQITDGADAVTRTVTVNLKSRVWFVKNNAAGGGQGRSGDPFTTLVAAQTASLAGDTLFVYGGSLANTGQNAGITLKANQKLHGEAIGLTVVNTINGVSNPVLVPATPANRPVIDNSAANSDGVTILNVGGVEVRGVSVSGTQDAIDVTTNGTSSGGATIADNVIRLPGVDGIHAAAGGSGAMTLAISNNDITGNARGMGLVRSAGTMTITAFANNTISGNTAGDGIMISGAVFDATPGASIDQVSGGATVIGASGNGTGASGMILQNVIGDLAFTDLDIYNDNGTGLAASSTGALNAGAGTGFRISVSAGVATLRANGGAVVQIGNASISLPLQDVQSTNSSSGGITLANAFGGVGSTAFSAANGLISRTGVASEAAFRVDGGNGNVTFPGSITSNSANAVIVANRTSDTLTLSGAITDTGSGIYLSNNTGASIVFTGALSLNTGSNTAFSATGGGTVTATNILGTSTVTTTFATALNVVNTTIGAAGLNFRSINAGTGASGPANGIVLFNTGGAGGLTVSGTGGAGSGGTIQRATNRGASFVNAANIALNQMNIINTATAVGAPCGSAAVAGANTGCNAAIHFDTVSTVNLDRLNLTTSGQQGINGINVTGLTLSNSVLSGLGNAPDEDGLHFTNLFGTNAITNTSITSSGDDNVNIQNLSGPASTIGFTGGSYNAAVQGSGLLFGSRGAANTTINITNVTVDNNFSGGVVADGFDNATLVLRLTGSTITNNNDGVQVSANNGVSTFNINGNSFVGNDFLAVTLLKAAFSTTGSLEGAVNNNTMNIANGRPTDAIFAFQAGAGALRAAINNNNILYAGTQRAILVSAGQDGSGTIDTTITGNIIDMQLDGSGNAVAGILAQAAITGPGNTSALCADVGGAGALFNTFVHSLGGTIPGGDVRVRQRNDGTVRLPGYAGAATNPGAVMTYLTSRNTLVSPPTATFDSTGYAGGAACAAPIIP